MKTFPIPTLPQDSPPRSILCRKTRLRSGQPRLIPEFRGRFISVERPILIDPQ